MALTIQKSNQLKSIAILMMLSLHLFNRDYINLFQPLVFIGSKPLSYYISLFSQACVPIFAFVSGYGLFYSFKSDGSSYLKKNIDRTKKLYIRYWIILLLFAVILGWILGKEGYPGDWQKFILNFIGAIKSYNGASWFLAIYVLFIFTSRFWFRLLDSLNPYVYIFGLIIAYLIGFYFRIYNRDVFQNSLLNWLHVQSALYFCTLLQFMLGAFSLKYDWGGKVANIFNLVKYKNLTAIVGIVFLILFRALVPNVIAAAFAALGFIFLFLQLKLGKVLEKSLDFFTPHSTNLWLVHMFFYAIYFREIIYAPQNPTLIFAWLVLWCLLASYLINFVYNKIYLIIK